MRKLSVFPLLFACSLSFGQNTESIEVKNQSTYSENSEIRVFYHDRSGGLHAEQKPTGCFVNRKFIGDSRILNHMNREQIKTLEVVKENFEENGVVYYGKILIEMKPDYKPKFLTLNALATKYLEGITNPIIYQIDEEVISNCSGYLVDENFMLKIIVDKIKTAKENTAIHLIKLITKSPENIKKANQISIKGAQM